MLDERRGQARRGAAAADEVDAAEAQLAPRRRRRADDGDALRAPTVGASAAKASTPRRDVNTSQSALAPRPPRARPAARACRSARSECRATRTASRRVREARGPFRAVFLAAREQHARARPILRTRRHGRAARVELRPHGGAERARIRARDACGAHDAGPLVHRDELVRAPSPLAVQYAPNATSQPPSARASASRSAVTAARLGAWSMRASAASTRRVVARGIAWRGRLAPAPARSAAGRGAARRCRSRRRGAARRAGARRRRPRARSRRSRLPSSLRMRVGTLPRSGSMRRSGRKCLSHTRRRADAVPTRAPVFSGSQSSAAPASASRAHEQEIGRIDALGHGGDRRARAATSSADP